MGLRETFLNALGANQPIKQENSALRGARDFLKNGNRDKLYPTWSDIKMSDSDMYSGYAYAVIQKRGNKVASLSKGNLTTWANPEIVDEFQKQEQDVIHPYLRLIEDSVDFTEKQFWKNISIYLDLAGRYYLGVVRGRITPTNPNLPVITTDPTKFIMLNPYEIRRVVDKNKQVAGYIERKKDGRYREWPVHQIIEMRELNPFDPENSQWAMTDAAKDAVYTINQSGDYTRQSLNGNIDAPGIITTDVLLNDEDFANFRARVVQHTKGEPLFGNGTGAIKWDSMQIDLDKAALLDINEINRTTLFAVSGTSKTALGIEQSGTTRETARVQQEQLLSDTVQPRLEDIVDFLNLDYKKNYPREYKKTGYKIEVESAVGRDYETDQKAVQLKQSQFQLAIQLIQSGYTIQSAYQFAEGKIDFEDLELEQGLDKPQIQSSGDDEEGLNENAPTSPNNGPRSGSGSEDGGEPVSENNSAQNGDNEAKKENSPTDLNGLEPHADLVENGGKGSGNFGHSGRPGEVGGSGDGGLASFKDKIASMDSPEELYDLQEGIVDERVVSILSKEADALPDEDKEHLKDFYDKTKVIREKLFELSDADIEAADGKIQEWVSGSVDWKWRKGDDFDPIDIELSKSTTRGLLEHAKDLTAYRLQVSDEMEPSKGSSFSLSKEFSTSSPDSETPFVFSQKVTEGNVLLTPNIVQAGYGYNESPNWQREIVLSNKEKLKPINNSLEEQTDPLEVLEVHECEDCKHERVETLFNEVQKSNKEVKEAYNTFLDEVRGLEKETIDACVRKVNVNAFEESDIIGERKKQSLTEKLKNILHKYWWAIFPLLASNSMSRRNKEYGTSATFVFDNALQESVDLNADRVAKGHMETILGDILNASNKAYTNVLEEAAAELIIKVYDDSPTKWEQYFEHKPTKAEALDSIRKTDILEQNRRIYERANTMAFEGYNRRDIIKAIRGEYKDISEKRAETIARNETARAFGKSQFEADRQFLNSVGKVEQAYKQLKSRRPASEKDKICPICNALIEKGPVPFEEPFLKYGESIEVVNGDKTQIFTANYEDIQGGNVHVNCFCFYELVFKNAQGEFVKTLNGVGDGKSDTLGGNSSAGGDNDAGDNQQTPKSVNARLDKHGKAHDKAGKYLAKAGLTGKPNWKAETIQELTQGGESENNG